MKKLLAAIAVALVGASLYSLVGRAGVSCSVPFTFQNNTTADATQVNSNFSSIITCLGNAASSGINSDITQIIGLTTPLAPAYGGSPVFVAGTSTGSANAQVVAATSPNSFALTAGYRASFIAGFTNTAALTLNIKATGALNVFRQSQLGTTAMVGGEIVAGQIVDVVYDGSRYILANKTYQIGSITGWGTTTAPAGSLIADGTCVSRTTYADLYSVYGSNFDPGGTCAGTDFRLPDGQGTAMVGRDGAGRITTPCNNNPIRGSSPSTIGTVCGAGTQAIGQTHLPSLNFSVTDPGHTHNFGFQPVQDGGGNYTLTPAGGALSLRSVSQLLPGTATGSAATGITVASGGSGTALATLPPVFVANYIVKY